MIETKYVKLATLLNEVIALPSEQKKMTSISAAISAARSFPIPTNGVENAHSHYDNFVRHTLEDNLCKFNENILIDLVLAGTVARAFWLVRYNTAHPDKRIPIQTSPGIDLFDRLFGINLYLDNDTIKLMQAFSDRIARCINLIDNIQ